MPWPSPFPSMLPAWTMHSTHSMELQAPKHIPKTSSTKQWPPFPAKLCQSNPISQFHLSQFHSYRPPILGIQCAPVRCKRYMELSLSDCAATVRKPQKETPGPPVLPGPLLHGFIGVHHLPHPPLAHCRGYLLRPHANHVGAVQIAWGRHGTREGECLSASSANIICTHTNCAPAQNGQRA